MPSAVQEAQVGGERLISRQRGRGNLQAAEGDKWGIMAMRTAVVREKE